MTLGFLNVPTQYEIKEIEKKFILHILFYQYILCIFEIPDRNYASVNENPVYM